jgi:hypothetical protein
MFGDRSPNTSRRGSERSNQKQQQHAEIPRALGGIRRGYQQGQCEQSPPSNGIHEVRVGKEK